MNDFKSFNLAVLTLFLSFRNKLELLLYDAVNFGEEMKGVTLCTFEFVMKRKIFSTNTCFCNSPLTILF
jgi:hypothetical protein